MNRILVDEVIDNIVKKDDNKLQCNIKKDINLLLNDKYDTFEFNIYDANINILFINEIKKDIKINFNINGGNTVFNIFGFNNSNLNIDAKLKKDGSKIEIYDSFVLYEENSININIDHESKNTISDVKNNVVTNALASSKIKVISSVKKGNKNCIINQDSKIISLNDTNKNSVEPILLIDEYEVEAKHSCFIGKFNEDEMFYLMSKGLNKREACNLLLEGTLIGIMKIDNEEKKYLKDKLTIRG